MTEETLRRFQAWKNLRNADVNHHPADDQRWIEAVITSYMQGDNLSMQDFLQLFNGEVPYDEVKRITNYYRGTRKRVKNIGDSAWWNAHVTL